MKVIHKKFQIIKIINGIIYGLLTGAIIIIFIILKSTSSDPDESLMKVWCLQNC